MHKANMTAIRRLVERDDIAEMIRGKGVIEIGSYNVNGSARTAIEPVGPCFYMGIDSRPGPGVDVVGDICDAGGIPIVDVVACTDTLEHIEDWRAAVDGLNGILKPGGLLIFSVPMPGFPYHEFPHDFWRFTEDDLRGIFANCIIQIGRAHV